MLGRPCGCSEPPRLKRGKPWNTSRRRTRCCCRGAWVALAGTRNCLERTGSDLLLPRGSAFNAALALGSNSLSVHFVPPRTSLLDRLRTPSAMNNCIRRSCLPPPPDVVLRTTIRGTQSVGHRRGDIDEPIELRRLGQVRNVLISIHKDIPPRESAGSSEVFLNKV